MPSNTIIALLGVEYEELFLKEISFSLNNSLKLFNNSISLPSAYDVKKYDILKIYKYLSKFKNTLMIQKKYL